MANALTCSSVAIVVSPGNVVSSAPWMQLTSSSGQGAGWVRWHRQLSSVAYGVSEDSLVVATGTGSDREVLLTITETVVSGADLISADVAASALFQGSAITPLQARMLDLLGSLDGQSPGATGRNQPQAIIPARSYPHGPRHLSGSVAFVPQREQLCATGVGDFGRIPPNRRLNCGIPPAPEEYDYPSRNMAVDPTDRELYEGVRGLEAT